MSKTDWSDRTAALDYFTKAARRSWDDPDTRALYEAAVHALRRSQDHTALQTRCNEFANEAKALRADLENERAMRAAEHDDTHSRIEKLLTETVELRAENERLRAWLEIAVEDYESHAGLSRLTNHWTNQVKAALAGTAP